MELRREIQIAIITLVALHLLTAFGAIGLMTRMSPAIGRILEENAYSIEAVGEMLSVIAFNPHAVNRESERVRFEQALERARRNITEAEEEPVIAEIEKRWPGLREGDLEARTASVRSLRKLEEINKRAMREVDEYAQFLGTTGAWAAVFLATVTFMISLVVIARTRARLLRPLEELHDVLRRSSEGDYHRRCVTTAAPPEMRRLMEAVNTLLDEQQARKPEESPSSAESEDSPSS